MSPGRLSDGRNGSPVVEAVGWSLSHKKECGHQRMCFSGGRPGGRAGGGDGQREGSGNES